MTFFRLWDPTSAKWSGTNSLQLARRVALPLLVSLAVIIALRMGRII
jgi:hypothetical protein